VCEASLFLQTKNCLFLFYLNTFPHPSQRARVESENYPLAPRGES
jgi:hypothetical protein